MKWFHNLQVGTKLIAGFLIVAAFGALIGLQGIRKSSDMNDMATILYNNETLGLSYVAEANVQFMAATRAIRSAILAHTREERAQHLKEMQHHLGNTYRELQAAQPTFVHPAGQQLLQRSVQAVQAYEAAVKDVVQALQQEALMEKLASAQTLSITVRPIAEQADGIMTELMAYRRSNAQQLDQQTEVTYQEIRWLLISITLLGVAAGVGIGLLLRRDITRQLGGEPKDVAQAATAIADGDLSSRIDTSQAAPGSVVHAMHAMQSSLQRVVHAVRSSSDSIATGSSQISSGSADLSQRTEEQASNLEETAASMEQLSSTVRANAETAEHATQLAQATSGVALKGGEVVDQVVHMMQEINASSHKISDIIGVIDSIAFQTNILALNAAVEAARAGEQGRGFAVVASEVRTLAQRSAEAAKEIKHLIQDSVGKAAAGSTLVHEAGKTMHDIVQQVQKVTTLIADINHASHEQTSGIAQVSSAVSQLDQVTQQNAALVEESAAAADSLNQQAQQLVRAVAVFKLGANSTFGDSLR